MLRHLPRPAKIIHQPPANPVSVPPRPIQHPPLQRLRLGRRQPQRLPRPLLTKILHETMRHVNEGQHAVIAPLRPKEKVLQVRQPLGVLREPLAPRVRVLPGL